MKYQKQKKQIVAKLKSLFGEMIDDNAKAIFDDYTRAFAEHDGEKDFVFPIGAPIKITDNGVSINVHLDLNWKVATKVSGDVEIRESDMVDEANSEEE